MDASPEIDVELIPAEEYMPTLTSGTSCTLAYISSQAPSSSTTSKPTRTIQVMYLKKGHLPHSANVWAAQFEAKVPWMINWTILAALTPFHTSIDTLTAIVDTSDS